MFALLLVLAGLWYLLLGGGFERFAGAPSEPSEPAVAAPVDVTVDEILDRAVDNGDGTMTVTVSEAEVGGLVRDHLSGGQAGLRDITVDLAEPDGSAPGQMELEGRLEDQDLPVTAIIDLQVSGGQVQPSVRDVRVGPLPVPGSIREDLDRQLTDVGLLADQDIDVEALHTTERELVVTGSRT